jgi:YidC/Oxa1 family membrane protein insertase
MFYQIFYRPFFNALVIIYQYIAFHDLGLAIILLTILVRALLYPLFHVSVKNQSMMTALQPKIKALQEEHKENKEKQVQAQMALYKEHGVNPFSGFLILLLQIPIFIGLYYVFSHPFSGEIFKALYPFVASPGSLNPTFLGLINLSTPSIVLVILAAILQYFQGAQMLPKKSEPGKEPAMGEAIQRNMVYVGPLVTLSILWRFPAAVALYWITTSAFSLFQQAIVIRRVRAKMLQHDQRTSNT